MGSKLKGNVEGQLHLFEDAGSMPAENSQPRGRQTRASMPKKSGHTSAGQSPKTTASPRVQPKFPVRSIPLSSIEQHPLVPSIFEELNLDEVWDHPDKFLTVSAITEILTAVVFDVVKVGTAYRCISPVRILNIAKEKLDEKTPVLIRIRSTATASEIRIALAREFLLLPLLYRLTRKAAALRTVYAALRNLNEAGVALAEPLTFKALASAAGCSKSLLERKPRARTH